MQNFLTYSFHINYSEEIFCYSSAHVGISSKSFPNSVNLVIVVPENCMFIYYCCNFLLYSITLLQFGVTWFRCLFSYCNDSIKAVDKGHMFFLVFFSIYSMCRASNIRGFNSLPPKFCLSFRPIPYNLPFALALEKFTRNQNA